MISYTKPIIVLAGPTASGKSSIAVKLAKEINGVIINADSRQVYKEISIGTARPSEKEMERVPHYLYGHISVKEDYNIYRYQKEVEDILKNISDTQTPILVGGSGLYIDSVIFNYNLSQETSEEIDQKRREELNDMSVKELQNLITSINPNLLKNLNESDRQNPVRLVRIIEKVEKKGVEEIVDSKNETLKHKYFVIDINKKDLKERIIKRTEKMFEEGLLGENIRIKEKGLEKYSALNTIGYQEFDKYFKKEATLESVKKEIIKNTNRYAKKQKTWFRKHEHAIWTGDYSLILEESLKLIRIL